MDFAYQHGGWQLMGKVGMIWWSLQGYLYDFHFRIQFLVYQ
jgi:hypothetical protein